MKPQLANNYHLDISQVFKAALENKASDIIITANTPPMLRIDGELYALGNRHLSPEESKKLVYSVLEKSQVARLETKRELDFSFAYEGGYRFRGNAYFQRESVSGVFRLIPTVIPSLDSLGLPEILSDICKSHSGLFLITGATGMGKSTTLAAMIAEINNTRNCHVVTVEDPIEFLHTNKSSVIDQRELGTDTLSFADAIKQSLRQSPDVILVGEMRDLETMAAALTAAETGHLVFATLHTRSTAKSLDRIVDSFPAAQQNQIREQLSMSLLGVLSQKLFQRPSGTGRVVATELLINTLAVANLIRERRIHQIGGLLETGRKYGMHSFESDLKDLVRQGYVRKDDAENFLGSEMKF